MHSLIEAIPPVLVTTIHVLASVFLIFFVLIQDSKGGGVFGSSSQSILGPTGAPTLFAKLTRYTAVVFAITSLVLTIQTTPSTRSALDSYVPPAATPEKSDAAAPQSEPPKADAPKEEPKKE